MDGEDKAALGRIRVYKQKHKVRACARAPAFVCVRVCVRVSDCACKGVCVCACNYGAWSRRLVTAPVVTAPGHGAWSRRLVTVPAVVTAPVVTAPGHGIFSLLEAASSIAPRARAGTVGSSTHLTLWTNSGRDGPGPGPGVVSGPPLGPV